MSRRGTGRAGVVLGGCLTLAAALATIGISAAAGQSAAAYGFDGPAAATLVKGDLFVANGAGNSVTEVNANTGAFVARIAGPKFKFQRPTAIQAVGTDLFVSNGAGNSLTEFKAANGALVRVIAGRKFKFSDPIAMATDGTGVFVLNAGRSVTEVTTASGHFKKYVSGTRYGFDAPTSIALAGSRLFVTNSGADSVTELSAKTLSLVSMLSGPSYQFSQPTGATYDGRDLWITNLTGKSVTEIAPATDTVVRVVINRWLPTPGPIVAGDGYVFAADPPGASPMITQVTSDDGSVNWMMCNTNGPYNFANPQSLVVSGADLWVVNEGGNSLTEMNADSGKLIAKIT
jgi:hypothetical protein